MRFKLFFILVLNYVFGFIYSQNSQNIETQEITVKKSFIPKVSIKEKIKSKIRISDTLTSKIESPKIFITSVPVASTFDPSKGTPKKLEILALKENFNSRFSFGFSSLSGASIGISLDLEK